MAINLFGHIQPSWKKEDLISLNFREDAHKDRELNDLYLNAGHLLEAMSIGLLQEDQVLPQWAIDLKKQFNLQKTTATIHQMRPGHYLPIHSDLYATYKKINRITDENIYRIIVFLEDWQPGHMLDINGTIYNSWCAGDYVGWVNDTKHAVYNLGTYNRYTLQITGTL